MATRMQQRRGTAAQWTSADPILEAGEIGFETDTNKFKIGDGVNHWEDLIYYASAADLAALVDNAPELLNTLNELAAAMGDDPDFFNSIGQSITNAVTVSNDYTDESVATIANNIADAVSDHNSDTTSVHGIANTATLADQSYVDLAVTGAEGYTDNAISIHSADTTSVHGIANTAALVYQSDLSNHATDTTNIHGISDTANLVTLTGTETLSNKTLSSPTITAGELTISSTEIGYLDGLTSGIQTQLNAKATPSDISTHNSATANVHGIADTSQIALLNANTQTFTGSMEVDGNFTVDGNFIVNGSNVLVSATQIQIEDSLLQIAHANANNVVDLGIVVAYTDGIVGKHSGIVRDVSEDKWKLFQGVTDEPSTTVNFGQGGLDDLAVNNIEVAGVVFTDGTQTKEGVASRTPIIQKTASYTLTALTERDSLIEVASSSGTTITIPTNSAVAYPVGTSIDILQTSTGQVTIAGDSGVTVNATPGLKLRAQWSSATLFKRDTDTWVVMGDLSA